MTARTWATFATAGLGPSLELEQAGSIVAASTIVDSARTARGTQLEASVNRYAEFVAWGEDDLVDAGAPLAAVGVCTASHSASARIGATADSTALYLHDGTIRRNGTTLATIAAVGKGQVIGVMLLPGALQMRVYVDGALAATVAITGAGWTFAASVGAQEAYGLRVFCNTGGRPFEIASPPAEGWYTAAAAPAPIRVSDSDWRSAATDTPAGEAYEARVARGARLQLRRRVHFWPWGRDGNDRGGGQIALANGDGRFDSLLADDVRDQVVQLRAHEAGYPLESAIVRASGIVDDVRATDDDQMVIRVRDALSLLDRPLQRRLFLPSVAGAANEPLPTALGACRNVEPVLTDADDRLFRISDGPLARIGVVRDRGDVLLNPADWTVLADSTGVQLATLPVGKLTADVSSTGDYGVAGPDAIGGIGSPFVWESGALVGWNDNTTNGSQTLGSLCFVLEVPGRTGVQMTLQSGGTDQEQTRIGRAAALTIGQSYTYRITIRSTTHPIELRSTIIPTGFAHATFAAPGTYTGTFVAAGTGFYVSFAQSLSLLKECEIAEVSVRATALIGTEVLDGMSLEGIAEALIERLGELPASSWVRADAQAIQVARNWRVGYFTRQPAVVGDVLREVLDTYLAGLTTDREGRIRMVMMRDPALADDAEVVFEIDRNNLARAPVASIDNAPGLTTQVGVRRNWARFTESDFVTDYAEVPAALRRQFMGVSQLIRTGALSLPETYRHARVAEPFHSLLDDPAHGDALLALALSLYAGGPRIFVTAQVLADGDTEINPGDIVRLTYPRYGCDAGRKFLVADINEQADNLFALTLWG